ncbi:hypothetical protein GQ607_003257 [Colletotrichum asianum]|uniref:Uncharacterized protein n=1 Tax=Colletotrichum asianum TaxID=702518 RepID=A0A8H3WMP2_9PEZI|nr:hypothetical protein GQ607_003257 [Colletotrichum asianum]
MVSRPLLLNLYKSRAEWTHPLAQISSARASTRSGALLSIFQYHGCIALGVAPILMTLPWAHISEHFPLPVTRESWQRAAGKGVAREAELRQASDHPLATHPRCM